MGRQRTHQSYCRRRLLPGRVVVLLRLCYGWGRGRRASRRVSRWGYKFLLLFGHVVQAFQRLFNCTVRRIPSFVHSCWLARPYRVRTLPYIERLHWRHVHFRVAKEREACPTKISPQRKFLLLRYTLVVGKMYHTYSSKIPHRPWVIIKWSGSVVCGHRTCMAEQGQTCSHVRAVFFLFGDTCS